MKNFVQPGNMITVSAPAGGVASGDGVLVGHLFGVAATTQAEGDEVELAVEGVFELPKVAPDAFAAVSKVYWDPVGKMTAPAPDTGNTFPVIGAATEAAGAGSASVRVRLNGVTV